MHRDDIHVAFAEDKVSAPASFCQIQAVKVVRFIENRRFRRIQVLRFAVSHDPSAKTDHAVRDIHNRIHDSVPELVMEPSLFVKGGNARQQNIFVRVSALSKVRDQIGVRAVRETKSEPVQSFIGKLPLSEIVHSASSTGRTQQPEIVGCRVFIDCKKPVPLLVFLLRFFAVLCFGELDARPVRKDFQCFLKCGIFVFHYERNHISAFAAAKTMINLLPRRYRKRRRLLIVERTQAHIARARTFHMYMFADHRYNVVRGDYLIYDFLRIIHPYCNFLP